MKIQLIHPPMDKQYTGKSSTVVQSAPVGLEIIAKTTELRTPDSEITIVDGLRTPLEQILTDIDHDIVGVDDWYSSHRNALTILQTAKQRGATTVIGGPNTTHLAERILTNNPFIDYAFVGDAEHSFSMLVEDLPLEQIPGLVYRENGEIIINPSEDAKLDILFDLEHLDPSVYDKDIHIPTSFIRGCIKAAQQERCSFCSIDHSLKLMDPELAWQQIDILTDYGFNYFFESGDSFMVGNFPERLLEARPEHLKDSTFKIYASPNQITPEKIKVLKELGVAAIFLGLETPEETILKKAGKTYTKQDIDRATSLISEAGIQLQVPFIYGLPGTTLETMETTFQYAKQLVESHPNTLVYGNKAIPIAGSQLFKDLASDPTIRAEYSGDLLRDDQLDYQQLVQLQTKHRTDVTYEQITEYVNKTRALVENENALGFGENK